MALKKSAAKPATNDDDMFSLGEESAPSKRYVPKAAVKTVGPRGCNAGPSGPSGPMGGPSGPSGPMGGPSGPSGPMGGPSGPAMAKCKCKKK